MNTLKLKNNSTSLKISDNSIIYLEDKQLNNYKQSRLTKNEIVYNEVMEQALKSSIILGTEKTIKETIEKIFKYLMENKVPMFDYQIFFIEMLTTILMAAKITNTDLNTIFNKNYINLFEELNKLHDLNQVKSWFHYIANKIVNYTNSCNHDCSTLLVEKAKCYIHKYYCNSNLSIKNVCDHLHISTSHFSFIFKRETNMTFLNYVTKIRMRSSEELLRTTNMKAIAIANEVGYSEPKYFSYCFKKYHGISPTEYRNNTRKL